MLKILRDAYDAKETENNITKEGEGEITALSILLAYFFL